MSNDRNELTQPAGESRNKVAVEATSNAHAGETITSLMDMVDAVLRGPLATNAHRSHAKTILQHAIEFAWCDGRAEGRREVIRDLVAIRAVPEPEAELRGGPLGSVGSVDVERGERQ